MRPYWLFIYMGNRKGNVESDLIRKHGFTPISFNTYDKIRMLFLGTINDKEESFCKHIDKNGMKTGPITPDLAQITNKTILVLTTKSDIDKIRTADDISAVLAFDYSNGRTIKVVGMCSNQVIKSNGGDLLVRHLMNASKKQGITISDKKHYITKRRTKKKMKMSKRII